MDFYLNLELKKPYVIVGDIHGCLEEFKKLINIVYEKYGSDTIIVSVGDTIDRGPLNIETLLFTIDLFKKGKYFEVKSNHLNKFVRWLKGSNVNISHGMQKTIEEFLSYNKNIQENIKENVINYYEHLPLYLIINNNVIVSHGGIKDEYIGRVDKKVKSFVLYGETTGRYTEKGFPERVDWTKDRKIDKNSLKIVYGHVVYDEPYINNLCYGIDTGACLGNKLTGYNPEKEEFIYIKSEKAYFSFD